MTVCLLGLSMYQYVLFVIIHIINITIIMIIIIIATITVLSILLFYFILGGALLNLSHVIAFKQTFSL